MIAIGYQGIGKSTLCNKGSGRYIDLESGNFWVDGKRDDNWASIYANIAEHLSKQGYQLTEQPFPLLKEKRQKTPGSLGPRKTTPYSVRCTMPDALKMI